MTSVRKSFLRGKSIKGHQPNRKHEEFSLQKTRKAKELAGTVGHTGAQVLQGCWNQPCEATPFLVSDLTLLGQLSDRVTPSTFARKTISLSRQLWQHEALLSCLRLRAARSQPDNYSSNFTEEKAAGAELTPGVQYMGPPEDPSPGPQPSHPPTRGVTPTRGTYMRGEESDVQERPRHLHETPGLRSLHSSPPSADEAAHPPLEISPFSLRPPHSDRVTSGRSMAESERHSVPLSAAALPTDWGDWEPDSVSDSGHCREPGSDSLWGERQWPSHPCPEPDGQAQGSLPRTRLCLGSVQTPILDDTATTQQHCCGIN